MLIGLDDTKEGSSVNFDKVIIDNAGKVSVGSPLVNEKANVSIKY